MGLEHLPLIHNNQFFNFFFNMDIQIISEQESQFTFGGGYPVKFYFGGEYQYNIISEEQLETIKVWAFKNDVHSLVCFEWGIVSLHITEHGALTSYPDQLFGHARRIYAEMIRINRERSIDLQQ